MNCSTAGYFAGGRFLRVVVCILTHGIRLRMVRILAHGTHSRAWYALARGAHSRAWCAFSRVVRILTRGAHSRAWCILARGAFSRVVRIGAWCVFSPMVRILARGTYLRVVRLAAAFEDPQQLISVRFGKWDNFPDRFGSDMQKYRFNIGRFGLFFGTDYIGSYCLEGPIHFGIGIGPGARTGTNRPNASSV